MSGRSFSGERKSQGFHGESSHQRAVSYLYNRDSFYSKSEGSEHVIRLSFHGRKIMSKSNIPLKIVREGQVVMARFVLLPQSHKQDVWRVVRHNKFPRPHARTQKRRALRKIAATSRRDELGKLDSKSKFG